MASMTDKTVISFETDGPRADEHLIRDYVLSAMERLSPLDSCENVGFLRYGHDPATDHGEVRLHLGGDTDAIITHEQDRWDALVTEGLAHTWTPIDEPDSNKFGPQGVTLCDRLTFLASEMSKLAFETFDRGEFPAAVDTYPDEGPLPVGWYVLLHFLADQQAQSADEEIDAYTEGIRNRLVALGDRYSYDRASTRIDCLIDSLEETREQLRTVIED